MSPTLLLMLLHTGCGVGLADRTTFTDVTVVNAVSSPAEVGPQESIGLDVYVADPELRDLEALVWTCAPYQDRCLEESLDLGDRMRVGRVEEGRLSLRLDTPSIDQETMDYLAQELGEKDWLGYTGLFVLACVVDTCPIIARAAEVLDDPQSDLMEAELLASLRDPTIWEPDLPKEGANLAGRVLPVSNRAIESRNQNPIFDVRFEDGVDGVVKAGRGEAVELSFGAYDPDGESVYAYGFTTAGHFIEYREKAQDGIARTVWVAPNEDVVGELFVVFDDRDGGLATWRAVAVVGSATYDPDKDTDKDTDTGSATGTTGGETTAYTGG